MTTFRDIPDIEETLNALKQQLITTTARIGKAWYSRELSYRKGILLYSAICKIESIKNRKPEAPFYSRHLNEYETTNRKKEVWKLVVELTKNNRNLVEKANLSFNLFWRHGLGETTLLADPKRIKQLNQDFLAANNANDTYQQALQKLQQRQSAITESIQQAIMALFRYYSDQLKDDDSGKELNDREQLCLQQATTATVALRKLEKLTGPTQHRLSKAIFNAFIAETDRRHEQYEHDRIRLWGTTPSSPVELLKQPKLHEQLLDPDWQAVIDYAQQNRNEQEETALSAHRFACRWKQYRTSIHSNQLQNRLAKPNPVITAEPSNRFGNYGFHGSDAFGDGASDEQQKESTNIPQTKQNAIQAISKKAEQPETSFLSALISCLKHWTNGLPKLFSKEGLNRKKLQRANSPNRYYPRLATISEETKEQLRAENSHEAGAPSQAGLFSRPAPATSTTGSINRPPSRA